jgi:hypothetical protein
MRNQGKVVSGRYDLTGLDTVRSIWDFDDLISPYNGFQGATGLLHSLELTTLY